MTTDLEWIQSAAQAVGFQWSKDPEITHDGLWITSPAEHYRTYWNPLKQDSDAFQLMVLLGISITPYPVFEPEKHSVIAKRHQSGDTDTQDYHNPTEVVEIYGDSPAVATRRAIVRCAAAIDVTK